MYFWSPSLPILQPTPLFYNGCSLSRIRPQASSASQEPVIDVSPTSPAPSRVRLITTDNCELGVSLYPNFGYKAAGGGGNGTVTDLGNGFLRVTWDIDTLVIPDLDWRTGSLFRLPIPPPINIAIKPQRLEVCTHVRMCARAHCTWHGTIKQDTGEVALDFDCEFFFTLGPLYAAPPLVINTLLTTESTRGRFREANGSRLNGNSVRGQVLVPANSATQEFSEGTFAIKRCFGA
eukprot:729971-Pelagomonas_calceolata.AAC.1